MQRSSLRDSDSGGMIPGEIRKASMPTQSPLSSELKDLYEAESSRLQHEFSSTKDGLSFLRQRSALVESIVLRLAGQFLSKEKAGLSKVVLLAIGDGGLQPANGRWERTQAPVVAFCTTMNRITRQSGGVESQERGWCSWR